MKILQIHNQYLFPGGEDSVVNTEAALLREQGHEVVLFCKDNVLIDQRPFMDKVKFFCGEFVYSRKIYNELTDLLKKERPDVVHAHNPFYIMTPAAYEACFDQGIPVVQTLHNYRFLCSAATFFREGKVCEECLKGGYWRGVLHRCWRGSFVSSLLLARLLHEYRRRKILDRISRFIVLSQFSYDKFVEAGWPKDRMVIKPNSFAIDSRSCEENRQSFVLFAGALQPYKGVTMLVEAWETHLKGIPLKIIGSGPLEEYVRAHAKGDIEFLGQKTGEDVIWHMHRAALLVVPSEWYENCPRVVIEAYSCRLPVVASRLGALVEMVRDGETGLLFEPGNGADLAEKVRELFSLVDKRRLFSKQARECFDSSYAPEQDYRRLFEIYRGVL
ncbi:MAG: glycosyltransferase [Candidatus Omnitrophica bacterium]|nr:glycosyltransferase [Candidatus Omnitrophota bacterium]